MKQSNDLKVLKRHTVFTEEINTITLSSNDDKRMQAIDLIETYAYGKSKVLVSEKEKIKCNNIIKRYKIDYLCWYYKRNIKNITQIGHKF